MKKIMAVPIAILIAVAFSGCLTVKVNDVPTLTPAPSVAASTPEASPAGAAQAEPFTGIIKIKSGDSYDVDGDGQKEKITLTMKDGKPDYTLKIGDDDISDTSNTPLTGDIYLANIVNGDGKLELFVYTPGESDDPVTSWYNYTDGVIGELGDITMDPASMKVEGDGTVKGKQKAYFVETFSYDTQYKINSDGTFAEDVPQYVNLDTPVTMLLKLQAHKDPTDSSPLDVTFNKGDKVVLKQTDMKEWLQIESSTDTAVTGWVKVENGQSIEGAPDKQFIDIFDGLIIAD